MFSESLSKPYVTDIAPRVARVAGGGPGLDEPPKARDRRGVRGRRCVRGRVVRLWRRSHRCRNAPEEEDEEDEKAEAKEAVAKEAAAAAAAASRLHTAPRAAARRAAMVIADATAGGRRRPLKRKADDVAEDAAAAAAAAEEEEEEQDDAVQLRQCRVAMEPVVKAAQCAGRRYFTPARVPRAERAAVAAAVAGVGEAGAGAGAVGGAGWKHVDAREHATAAASAEGTYKEAVVMHMCDNPRCVNPLHLRWGFRSTNAARSTAAHEWVLECASVPAREPITPPGRAESAWLPGLAARPQREAVPLAVAFAAPPPPAPSS
ncbi:hypothetical protein PLESTB_001160200 [Pleodorina starrii]|uniref:Zinc-binding loop region of homing endonuclease domain-containing protein n=1 Tax=Pleodorina starrii TaxID=330485 RepID=A0A9W6BS08_9CHLO|nr:hypothetical protein PLESTB_001160200 [Pleodorina starrii]